MKAEIGLMNQLTTKNILDDVAFAVENGFDWFEIGLDWKQNFNLGKDTIRDIKKISKENDLSLIVHTPFYLPVSTILPEIRKSVFENLTNASKLAEKVGAKRMTIHPGFREMPGPGINITYESLISNLKKIVGIGKEYDVEICLENLDNNDFFLCIEKEDYLRVLNSVNGLKSTLDVGHANTSKTKPHKYFESVKDFVMDMHVHDNDGKIDEHNCLGEGNINFKKLFSECKKHEYYGPFTLELFPYENILKGKKILEKIWKDA